ncbi:hypothetical protein VBH21_14190 [Enterococcus hirae]|uniref:hypothetical protein n=1 Tax=Enterococcus TaxID=1350 RepID=UPI0009BDABE7|nr:hypothetical protein [Enterococcus hirae]EMF0042566.1 hypothetical protein [Enterococcus hirae]EMF0136957.1 hypothetical protein [Enterococcus hirae]EMF0511461.1 hypothetical protein [Enterococcus hirae]EMF0623345.1 hypothetical protein [Enterococcus hirae]OQO39847.1 hypothetical protein BH758_13590 [Enterococcus hirae]
MIKKRYLYRVGQIFLILFSVWFVVTLFFIIKNQFGMNYKDLSKSNQIMLQEIEDYYKAYKTKQVWAGYDLNKYSFLAVDGRGGEAYLINPKKTVKSIFAKEINMPSDSAVKVYRIAAMSPLLYKTYGIGKFNTLGEQVNVCANEVFYLRYEKDKNIADGDYDSSHFITFLAHEVFHNQVQTSWGNEDLGGRFSTESLTDKDKELLATRYDILQTIQEEVWKGTPNLELLKQNIKKYIVESEKLKKSNPAYFKEETMAETFEGTATYVSAKASKAANYKYNVTCYRNIEHIPFNKLMPIIEKGQMDISTISSDWVYSSGGLWCEVLDKLGNTKWQTRLNNQTTKNPVTLYNLVKESVI